MASLVHLDDVSFGDPEVDAAFRKWREAIEQANNWQVFGAAQFEPGPTGYTLHVKSGRNLQRAVVTTAIPPAPDADSVSDDGRATLRVRTGTALEDGATGQVIYSDWSAEIAVGTRIQVEPDGDGWMLVTTDCP